MNNHLLYQMLLGILVFIGFFNPISAQKTWTGTTSTNWNVGSNWNPAGVPAATDYVQIPNVANQPVIGAGTAAVGIYVGVDASATLTIAAMGSLAINGSGSSSIQNFGTVTNNGTITMGNISSNLGGIYNGGTFNNNTGGQIFSDQTGTPIWNASGIFNNAGTLTFGGTAGFGDFGIHNQATFNNNTGGQISIDRAATGLGNYVIWNRGSATFNNAATITLGGTAATGFVGIRNEGTFNNNTGGQISIDRSTDMGIWAVSGTFTNAATITIGGTASPGAYGIWNVGSSTFNNNTGGQISIDRSTGAGIRNQAPFNNAATITIGAAGSVGINGIWNLGGTFNNTTCAAFINILSNNNIENSGPFTNAGLLRENATGNSSITSNSGIVQNLNGGTFTIGTNTGTLTTSISAPPCSTSGTRTWTGTAGTDWNTPCNWNPACVPTASDDVVIPNVANDPTIGAGTAALAKTVVVNTSSVLTIAATGSLTIDGAIINDGTVNNSGTITIGVNVSAGQVGLWNKATFNNNTGGQINIDRSTYSELYNESGTFTNAATITIGANVSAAFYGLDNRATFNNNTGGQINIDRSSEYGLFNGGTFTNAATITIGANESVGINGLMNTAAFNNNTGGQINIDRSTSRGLNNEFGNSIIAAIFNNAATIIIGANANASVGSFGLKNTATFNNNTGGQINIDRSTSSGLYNTTGFWTNGIFNNAATITIGANASVGSFGLENQATFNNNACATLTTNYPVSNGTSGTINNAGLFTSNTTGTHSNNRPFNNNGVLHYPQGNPIPSVTNNDVIVTPISGGCSISPALTLGGAVLFTVGSTWYLNSNLTNQAGTYNQATNTFTSTNLPSGVQTTVYFQITDNANTSCPRTVSIKITASIATEIVADGIDQNCDGKELCYNDGDDDGYTTASPATIVSADLDCTDPNEEPSVDSPADCNDGNAAIKPTATETCSNNLDDDCDGLTDEGCGTPVDICAAIGNLSAMINALPEPPADATTKFWLTMALENTKMFYQMGFGQWAVAMLGPSLEYESFRYWIFNFNSTNPKKLTDAQKNLLNGAAFDLIAAINNGTATCSNPRPGDGSVTGVVEQVPTASEVKMLVSPNPTSGPLTIQFFDFENSAAADLQIFDATGRLAYRQTVEPGTSRLEIDLSENGLANGFYTLRARVGEQILTRKVSVVR